MKTYAPKPQDIERRWYVIDAQGAVLGRLATEVASILRGKHKPIYAPHADTGDNVIVVNAKGIELTGAKHDKKFAYRHSGYPGGLTATKYGHLLEDKPTFLIEKAVKGMLPHNRLGRSMVKKLHVYEGPEHRHEAQQPVALKLGEVPPWSGLPERAPAPTSEVAAEPKRVAARTAAKPKTPAKPKAAATSTKPAAKPKTSPAKPKAAASDKPAAAKRATTKPKAAPKKPSTTDDSEE